MSDFINIFIHAVTQLTFFSSLAFPLQSVLRSQFSTCVAHSISSRQLAQVDLYGMVHSHTHTYTQINKHRIPEVNLRQTSTTQHTHTHIRMLCLSEWYCENQTPYRVSGTLPVLGSEPCAPILQNFSKTKTRALNH